MSKSKIILITVIIVLLIAWFIPIIPRREVICGIVPPCGPTGSYNLITLKDFLQTLGYNIGVSLR